MQSPSAAIELVARGPQAADGRALLQARHHPLVGRRPRAVRGLVRPMRHQLGNGPAAMVDREALAPLQVLAPLGGFPVDCHHGDASQIVHLIVVYAL